MRRKSILILSLTAIAGAVILWAFFRIPTGGLPAAQAAGDGPTKKPNLSLWVPEEELRVWDPVNPNVNPVPWRVYGPARDGGQRAAEFRHAAVGKRVRVEGVGWGYDVKTDLPKSRVVFEGGIVLVAGVDLNKPEARGKLVRVVGTLRREAMPHPGFDRQFPDYYRLDAESVEFIDRVSDPRVVLDPK